MSNHWIAVLGSKNLYICGRATVTRNGGGSRHVDFLVVRGVSDTPLPRDMRVATYKDHRMAMSLAMLGVRSPGLQIEEPDVVKKSFPELEGSLYGRLQDWFYAPVTSPAS